MAHPWEPAANYKPPRAQAYGVITVLWLVGSLSLALPLFAYGLALPAVEQDTGWSRSHLSVGGSLLSFMTVLTPLVGALVDRFGPRPIIVASALLALIGAGAAAGAMSVWTFVVGAGLLTGLAALGLTNVPSIVLSLRWFPNDPATAIGILSTAGVAGGIFGPPLALLLMDTSLGWRSIWVAQLFVAISTVVLVWIFVRNPPSSLAIAGASARAVGDGRPKTSASGFSALRIALKSPSFWALSLGGMAGVAMITTLLVHLPAALQETGLSRQNIAYLLPVMACASMGSRVGAAVLSRYYQPHHISALSLALLAAAVLLLWFGSRDPLVVLSCGVLVGAMWGPWNSLGLVQVAIYFGYSGYATTAGLYRGLTTGLGSLGPVLAGILYSWQGSYDIAFTSMATVCVVGALAVALIRPTPSIEPDVLRTS